MIAPGPAARGRPLFSKSACGGGIVRVCYHNKIFVTAKTEKDTYEIEGNVLSLIPLRNQRKTPEGELLMTRITEGMTEWRSRGKAGYGLSEYLDQIVEGRPVGAA